MIRMNKSEREFIHRILNTVEGLLGQDGELEDTVIEKVVRDIEGVSKYRLKDFETAINYFRSIKHFMEEEGTDNKEDYIINSESERVLRLVIDKRKYRNSAVSKVDTNIITHAPYFVGGSYKRKKEAKDEGYVVIKKEGISKVRYENNRGELLTMSDAKVLFALFYLWEEQGYSEWVSFTEYQIMTTLNLRVGGKQYTRIRQSLKKLWNTTIVMQEAYNIDTGKKEVTSRFKLIEADKVSEEYNEQGDLQNKTYEVKFSEQISASMEGEYYTLISLAVFNELEVSTAQGIYLMIVGIYDMRDNARYLREDKSIEIDIKDVMGNLYLESTPAKNRQLIEKGCTELKDVGVLDEYYITYRGRRLDKLVLEPTEWIKGVNRGTVKELGQLDFKDLG